MHMAAILDLVGGEDALKMKMDLIEVFCERFPVDDDAQMIKWLEISFSCPHGNLKTETSLLGFLLLEETKLAVGLTVEDITVNDLAEPLLSALANTIASQQKRVESAFFSGFAFESKKSTQALNTIMERCNKLNFSDGVIFEVYGDIEEEGWAVLLKVALYCRGTNPHHETAVDVHASRETLTGARREDLRSIWDVMGTRGCWEVESSKYDGRQGVGSELFRTSEVEWEALEQVLDMSNEEWEARFDDIGGLQGQEQEDNEHEDEEYNNVNEEQDNQ